MFSRQIRLDTDANTRRTLTSRGTVSDSLKFRTHKDQILNSILHGSKKNAEDPQEWLPLENLASS